MLIRTISKTTITSLSLFICANSIHSQDIPALGIRVTKTHIESTATGKAPEKAAGETQRKALARDAAVVAAQAHLIGYLEELKKGGQTLKELARKDKKINLKIKSALSRAEIVSTQWSNDQSAVVTLRLSKKNAKVMRGVTVP